MAHEFGHRGYGTGSQNFPLPSDSPIAGRTDPAITTPASASDEYYRRLMQLMPSRRQQGMSDLSSILGSYSSGEKANRALRGDFQGNYDRLMSEIEANRNRLGLESQSDYDRLKLLAGAEQRDVINDAISNLQRAEYMKSGGIGRDYAPMTQAPGGVRLPSFAGGGLMQGQQIAPGIGGPRAMSPTEIEAAGGLSADMLAKLRAPTFEPTKFEPTSTFQPMDPSQYAKPGLAERLGSYGALATGGLSALDMIFGRGGGAGGTGGAGGLSSIPGMAGVGGAIKGAGSRIGNFLGGAGGRFVAAPAAAALGTYGLMKDRGLGSNLMSGATAGAGYGTMIMPGLGTAVGAGLGALAGGLRGAFGVSEKEKQGREIGGEAVQRITQGASPEQQQEAQAASRQGAGKPEDALMHIVLRDRLGDDAKAGQYLQQIKQAERGGPQAVESVIQRMMQDPALRGRA